jgi:predicted chitinase
MTKAINGGTKGLANRTEFLTEAKGLLTMLELKPVRRA